MSVIFKIGTYIPAPGVNPAAFDNPQGSQGATELLNTFGGRSLETIFYFCNGIVPYITASIVMQLLQMDIVPKFSEWAKQGEVGRRKLNNVTRYLAISLAFIQSIGMAFQFNNYLKGALIINQSIMSYLLIALVLTAGTAFLIWLGDQITQFGVGNGISIIIFAVFINVASQSNSIWTNCVRWARRYIISMVESIRTFHVINYINSRCYLCT
ncbi:preprotein translocase subunit SecY [Staphylococcus aureus]